jgi:hypothetical protein
VQLKIYLQINGDTATINPLLDWDMRATGKQEMNRYLLILLGGPKKSYYNSSDYEGCYVLEYSFVEVYRRFGGTYSL